MYAIMVSENFLEGQFGKRVAFEVLPYFYPN